MKILISGYKRSGKDFVADKLKKLLDSFGMANERLSFAAPMKRIIAKTFGITEEFLDVCKNAPDEFLIQVTKNGEVLHSTNFREVLQRFGSDAMKPEFGENVWAELLDSRADSEKVSIVSDWRFPIERTNESDICVRVKNPEVLNTDTHESETALDDYAMDVTITNIKGINPSMLPIYKKIKEQ